MKSKLSTEQIMEAIDRLEMGETLKSLTHEFEISASQLANIRDRVGRIARHRMCNAMYLAIKCNVSLEDLKNDFVRTIEFYHRHVAKDFQEEIDKHFL
jgi:hypothetical protein